MGQIQNKGVEMAVTWRDQIGEWGYSVSANLTTIKNEVKSLVQEGYSIIAGDSSKVIQWQAIRSVTSTVIR